MYLFRDRCCSHDSFDCLRHISCSNCKCFAVPFLRASSTPSPYSSSSSTSSTVTSPALPFALSSACISVYVQVLLG